MIPVFRPSYGREELKRVKKVLSSGWIGLGPRVAEFEKAFAEYTGVRHAVAVNSCTAALHLALMVMDVRDKEVITTPMTFVSTNHAILYNGGIPVFADIRPDTLCIDPAEVKKSITERTRAIIAVHYGGHACDMEALREARAGKEILILEDAAHACGGEYKGQKAGTLGDMACFSFHAVKNLATGDGGMITTNDDSAAERLRRLRWVGITKETWERERQEPFKYSWYYRVEELGFKYHMNDINAALGLAQLGKLDWMNRRRREISRMYTEGLSGVRGLGLPVVKDYALSACHNYVVKTEQRDGLNEFLAQKGISTGVHYIPNNQYDMYKKYGRPTPVAEKVWKTLLTLPLFPDLKKREIRHIIDSIRAFFKSHGS